MKRLIWSFVAFSILLALEPTTAAVSDTPPTIVDRKSSTEQVSPPDGAGLTSIWFPPPMHFVATLATLEMRDDGQGFYFEEDVEKNPPGCWRLADTAVSQAAGFGGKNRLIWCHRGYPIDQGTLRIGDTLGIFTGPGPTQEGVNFFIATVVAKVIIDRDDEEAVMRETWRPAITLISCEGDGDDPLQRLVIRAVFDPTKRGGEMVFPRVDWGDSLESLAWRFSADAGEIRRLNTISNEELRVGRFLAVPLPASNGLVVGVRR